MTELDQLISQSLTLCSLLDKMSMNEKNFCVDMCIQLEIWSCETYRMVGALKQIKERG